MKYLLFDGNYSQLGNGAHGFLSAHETQEDAEAAGKDFIQRLSGVMLSQWMHLAFFDNVRMQVIRRLNIPGTEYAQSDVLEWIEA